MTNDKLLETTNEQIKAEAKDIAGKIPVKCDGDVIYKVGYEEGYIAGATAENERMHSELHETKQQADNLRIAYDELGRKAQRMANALEELVELKRMSDEEPLSLDYLNRKALAWEAARKAIQQFKDGKEVVRPEHNVSIGEHITYCHACGFPVDECNCIENNNPTK